MATQNYTLSLHDALPICFNDLDATLAVAEKRFATFSNDTPPEEIDFFDAILVYLHVLHGLDRKSTRLNSSHVKISYAVFCLKKKKKSPRIIVYVEYLMKP